MDSDNPCISDSVHWSIDYKVKMHKVRLNFKAFTSTLDDDIKVQFQSLCHSQNWSYICIQHHWSNTAHFFISFLLFCTETPTLNSWPKSHDRKHNNYLHFDWKFYRASSNDFFLKVIQPESLTYWLMCSLHITLFYFIYNQCRFVEYCPCLTDMFFHNLIYF